MSTLFALVAITMNIVGRRRKRSSNSFDIKESENIVQDWLNNGSAMMEPANVISPLIAKSGEYILEGEL